MSGSPVNIEKLSLEMSARSGDAISGYGPVTFGGVNNSKGVPTWIVITGLLATLGFIYWKGK